MQFQIPSCSSFKLLMMMSTWKPSMSMTGSTFEQVPRFPPNLLRSNEHAHYVSVLSPRAFSLFKLGSPLFSFSRRISRPATMVRRRKVTRNKRVLIVVHFYSVYVQERRSPGGSTDPQDQDHPHQSKRQEFGKGLVLYRYIFYDSSFLKLVCIII